MPGHIVTLLRDERVEEFNAYRKKNPDVEIDISDIDLSGKVLRGINLSGIDLREVRLANARLCGSDLRGTQLPDDMHGCCIARAKLPELDLGKFDLSMVFTTCPANMILTRLEEHLEAAEAAQALETLFISAIYFRLGIPIPVR